MDDLRMAGDVWWEERETQLTESTNLMHLYVVNKDITSCRHYAYGRIGIASDTVHFILT